MSEEIIQHVAHAAFTEAEWLSFDVYSNHPAVERFWAKVDRSGGQEECWPWIGSIGSGGYGTFTIKHGDRGQKTINTHRCAWIFAHGQDIPNSLHVMHKCDNRPCCNPSHLDLGTNLQNMADCKKKGRTVTGDRTTLRKHPELVKRGSQSPTAKITEDQVRQIYALSATGVSQYKIGRLLAICQTHIGRIIRGERWSHIYKSEHKAG